MRDTAVTITNLSRIYSGARGRPDTEALRGLSLEIGAGEIFGVLGPNGAGKTTLIRILSTLLTPTSGSAMVAGQDVVSSAQQVRRRIGVVFGGERGLYDRLSAQDNLFFAAQLYDVPRRQVRSRVDELLELVSLRDQAKSRVETFSRGMKQRLHIARALIHEPQVVFLDEPSAGLDPVAARALRDLVRMLKEQGRTVLLTTHYLFEADELCQRVAVIAAGQLRRLGSPEQVKGSVRLGRVFEVEVYDDISPALEALRDLPGVAGLEALAGEGVNRLRLRVAEGSSLTLEALLGELSVRLGNPPLGAALERGPTLEDAYVAIVEASESMRESTADYTEANTEINTAGSEAQ